MAQTSGYQYDIFISYAHDDNAVPKNHTVWISRFSDYLHDDWVEKLAGTIRSFTGYAKRRWI